MKKQGYIVCGGNLFWHENAYVYAQIVNWTCGPKLALFTNNAKDFALLSEKVKDLFGKGFNIEYRQGLEVAKDKFDLYIQIWGDPYKNFEKIENLIGEYSQSNFVQCD